MNQHGVPKIWAEQFAKTLDEQMFFADEFQKQAEREFNKWYKSLNIFQMAKYHIGINIKKYIHIIWMKIPIRIIKTKQYENLKDYDW